MWLPDGLENGRIGAHILRMGRNLAIIGAGAVIAMAILVTFRWEVGSSAGMTVRLDRWTGEIIGCNAPSQMIVDASSLGLPVRFRCSDLTPDEIKQGKVDPTGK